MEVPFSGTTYLHLPYPQTSSPWRTTAIPSKAKQLYPILILVLVVSFLTIFVLYYFYQTLLLKNPALGHLLLSPSATLLTVTGLSSVLSYLTGMLLSQLSDARRWQMASTATGVPLMTFFSLSSATSIIGVFQLLFVKGGHIFWCVQRYVPFHCFN
jgi:hypothetical protein